VQARAEEYARSVSLKNDLDSTLAAIETGERDMGVVSETYARASELKAADQQAEADELFQAVLDSAAGRGGEL
jgi:hypothetical protein